MPRLLARLVPCLAGRRAGAHPVIASAIATALAQVADPRFRGVLAKGVGLTLLGLIVLQAAAFWLLGWLLPDEVTLPWIGTVGWLDTVASGAGVIVLLAASVVLMIPVASAVISLFLDEVADAVEARHYPALPQAPRTPLVDSLREGAGFFALMLGVNALAVVGYLVLAPAAPAIFVAVNGALLGREYFQLVAMRRLGREAASRMRRRHRGTIWAAGALMALPLMVPVLNLVVPIVGAAAFTHLFHAIRSRDARSGPDRRP